MTEIEQLKLENEMLKKEVETLKQKIITIEKDHHLIDEYLDYHINEEVRISILGIKPNSPNGSGFFNLSNLYKDYKKLIPYINSANCGLYGALREFKRKNNLRGFNSKQFFIFIRLWYSLIQSKKTDKKEEIFENLLRCKSFHDMPFVEFYPHFLWVLPDINQRIETIKNEASDLYNFLLIEDSDRGSEEFIKSKKWLSTDIYKNWKAYKGVLEKINLHP